MLITLPVNAVRALNKYTKNLTKNGGKFEYYIVTTEGTLFGCDGVKACRLDLRNKIPLQFDKKVISDYAYNHTDTFKDVVFGEFTALGLPRVNTIPRGTEYVVYNLDDSSITFSTDPVGGVKLECVHQIKFVPINKGTLAGYHLKRLKGWLEVNFTDEYECTIGEISRMTYSTKNMAQALDGFNHVAEKGKDPAVTFGVGKVNIIDGEVPPTLMIGANVQYNMVACLMPAHDRL